MNNKTMKKILFILMLFPLLVWGQIINTKPVVGAVSDVETITLTHNDSTKSILKKVNIVTVSTFASNSAVMILLNGADNTQQYYTIRPSQMLYPIVTAQGLVDSLVAWLNISGGGGGGGGSGVTDFVLEDGYNLVLTAGSVFTVPINEITVGTFGSYTGIVDGDSLSLYGRQGIGGEIYGTFILEDAANLSYLNTDSSKSEVSVIDTSVYCVHTRSDGLVSGLVATPTMSGITYEGGAGTLAFVGVDSIRSTINYQNADNTESYAYFRDTASIVGYKNSATDRRELIILPASAGISSYDSARSSAVTTYPDYMEIASSQTDTTTLRISPDVVLLNMTVGGGNRIFADDSITMLNVPSQPQAFLFSGDIASLADTLPNIGGGVGGYAANDYNEANRWKYSYHTTNNQATTIQSSEGTCNNFGGTAPCGLGDTTYLTDIGVGGQNVGMHSTETWGGLNDGWTCDFSITPRQLNVYVNGPGTEPIGQLQIANSGTFLTGGFSRTTTIGGGDENLTPAYVICDPVNTSVFIRTSNTVIGDVGDSTNGFKATVDASGQLFTITDTLGTIFSVGGSGTDNTEINTTTITSTNATGIIYPAMLTVASTSLDQATQATDDPTGWGNIQNGSIYKNTDNIIFWKP